MKYFTKFFLLSDLIKETYKIFKTIIFCDKSEMEEVALLLLLKGFEITVIDEDLSEEGVRHLEESWTLLKGGEYKGKFKLILLSLAFLFLFFNE